MAAGMFGNLFEQLTRSKLSEEEQMHQYQAQDPFRAMAHTAYSGGTLAGQGLARAGSAAAGGDPRSRTELAQASRDAAAAEIKTAVTGLAPGTDEYFAAIIAVLNKHGLVDQATAIQEKWEASKLTKARTGAAERENQPRPSTMQERLDEVNMKLLSDPDDPMLLAMKTNIERILKINDKAPLVNNEFPIGDNKVQPHVSHDNGKTWQPVPGSQPRPLFAKQVAPTTTVEAPISAVRITDPKDLTKTLAVNGRTFNREKYLAGDMTGVIGEGERLSQVGALNLKHQIAHAGTKAAIDSARSILQGATGNVPTESGIGTGIDYLASLVGWTPDGAKEADQLRVAGGSLVRMVPRFEGPQSDKDVAYYKEVAGRIGDSTIPVARRLAALDEVERIWGEFEAGKKFGFFPGVQQPPRPSQADVREQDGPPPGAVRVKEKRK